MNLEERRNKIFLIGNGFDIAHGLPTKYLQFITWYLNNSCLEAIAKGYYVDDCLRVEINKSYFENNQLDIEEEIRNNFSDNKFWELLDKRGTNALLVNGRLKPYSNDWTIKIEAKTEFCENLFWNCRKEGWNGIEAEINRIMLKEHNSLTAFRLQIQINKNMSANYINSIKVIRELNRSIRQLKAKLIEYLKQNNAPKVNRYNLLLNPTNNNWGEDFPVGSFKTAVGDEIRDMPPKEVYRDVLFLNFNYTTYFETQILKKFKEQFRDNYTKFQTIFIHGSLEEPIDDIVFGVGDENKETYSEIESLYDDDWLDPLKSFHYLRNEKYQKLLGFIKKADYEIYVIGHSCGITDRTLLNMLFENKECKKIHVYHFDGMSSYMTTAYNIARNFNDKVRLREVLQPFNANLSTK